MNIVLYILIFISGITFGSFFTLAIHRIPKRQNITHERSYCPSCNHKLQFLDLIPVLSYIFLKGKCRYCDKKIGIKYFLIEMLSGLSFVLLALSMGINVYTLNTLTVGIFICSCLYLIFVFLIAGIDKNTNKVDKFVLLYGIGVTLIYMIYLCVMKSNYVIYRYIIYLFVIFVVLLLSNYFLKKKAKNIYALDIIVLTMIMAIFTSEIAIVITVILTLLIICFVILINKILQKWTKYKKKENEISLKENLPIAFYMCVSNIIAMIIVNFILF